MRRLTPPKLVLGALVVAYIIIFGALSLRRHQNLRTNALDLGYTDQAVWNTLHGRPFRFSTYLDAAFGLDIPIHQFEQPDVLLGYHVEPILAAIAPLYLIHDGPETLLWLQTIVIALGAIPLYLVVRRRFASHRLALPGRDVDLSAWLPLAFAFLYLLAPPLEAANLSDFHAVALSPTFLLTAFYFLEIDRPWGFVAFAVLAAICKEEIGLVVAMMGLWAAIMRRRWWLGLGAALAGAGWSLLCFLVIMPHFSGLSGSAFLVRYGHLGGSPAQIVRNLVLQPGIFVEWLRQPPVVRYLRDLWRTSGGLAILHPPSLAIALPAVAINALSSYEWMHSGGAHYSASTVPFLVVSAAYGAEWLARQLGKLGDNHDLLAAYASLGLVAMALAVGLAFHHREGISPLSRRFAFEPVSARARHAAPLIGWVNRLPPDVAISASSGLYPHVAHRERVYLFPTVSDAQVIFLDVTGPPSPVGLGEQYGRVRTLLDYAQFGVVRSDYGLLLLGRDADEFGLSADFYAVFRTPGAEPQVVQQADVGGQLRLEGFDWSVLPVVRPDLEVEIATYWRTLAPLAEGYRWVLVAWDDQYRPLFRYVEEPVATWYPTWLWEPGELVRVRFPPLPVGDAPHVGLAVIRPGFDPFDEEGRLVPIEPISGPLLPLREGNTILELALP